MALKKKNSSKGSLFSLIKRIVFSSQGFPILLTFAVLGMLFVMFRMKEVELDYEMIEVNKNIARVQLEHKELKVRKAKMLSVKKLRQLAKKFDLHPPKQEQIIVIP